MREKIVDSVLGYVNGCVKKGVSVEKWKVVKIGVLVWLESEELGIRIREKLVNDEE